MFVEVVREAYDFYGEQISKPSKRKHRFFKPDFPLGFYVRRELLHTFKTFDELRFFLKTCRYVSDQQQFGVRDYWMPPDEFEQKRKGDCEDFALYTWKQMFSMGYDARYVVGFAGFYGMCHAWVTAKIDGTDMLVEPLLSRLKRMSKLSSIFYRPIVSVSWDGNDVRYYEHQRLSYVPKLKEIIPLLVEWLRIVPVFLIGAWARYFWFLLFNANKQRNG